MGLIWKIGKYSLMLTTLGIFALLTCNYWIISSTKTKIYNQLSDVEARDVALVLGTSRSVNGVHENPFFTNRVKAAADLYHQGKVRHILVSGDNSTNRYNEPRDMRLALLRLGVPDTCITMDFAGFRTLDSVVRCKKVFQQKKITIVSQEFHNHRALYIADYHGLDAIAYNAAPPSFPTPKTQFREYLARPKALLDLYILGTQPRFLGEKINIHV